MKKRLHYGKPAVIDHKSIPENPLPPRSFSQSILRFRVVDYPAKKLSKHNPIKIGWGRKIAPRLGGAYDPFGTGKTKIFASYGWFYDRLRFSLPRRSFGGDFSQVDYFPITADHPNYDYYTPARILGNFTDPRGDGTSHEETKKTKKVRKISALSLSSFSSFLRGVISSQCCLV
jgi:hypothetical protein